jgi:(E)-4-hydroxy-3-methylbut-2-enyl-diphosphate synthase
VTPRGLGDDPAHDLAFAAFCRAVAEHEDHAVLVALEAPDLLSAETPGAADQYSALSLRTCELVGIARATVGPHGPLPVLAALVGPPSVEPVGAYRALAATLDARALDVPLLLVTSVRPRADSRAASAWEDVQLQAALRLGSLLVSGIGDAVRIDGLLDAPRAVDLAYGILQGARARTTKTEYISCPSCGRTLFDLESTTALIKAKTEHLKGVKIGIMGCIVNGPGEMADADFGYVGWKPGKVNLYVGKEVVVRDVDEAAAADRLVQLIRDRGRWTEPSPASREPALLQGAAATAGATPRA